MKNKKEKSQNIKTENLPPVIIAQMILLLVVHHLPNLKTNDFYLTLIYCLLDVIIVCLAGIVLNRRENTCCIIFELILSMLLMVHFICCLYVIADISFSYYAGNLVATFPKI